MQTIRVEVEDNKLDAFLEMLQELKSSLISKYEVLNEKKYTKDFINISEKSLEKIWDNKEDSSYDRFL